MTTTHAPHRPPFLNAVLNPAPTPGVPLSDPLVAQTLHLPPGTVRTLRSNAYAWCQHYRTVYARLQVPWDWVHFWVVQAEVPEVVALRRLQRLLALLAADPTAQDLTVAEGVSALAEGLLVHHRTAALLRPSIRQPFIAKAH